MSKIIDAQRVIVDACHLFSVIGFATDDGADPTLQLAAVNGVAKIGEDKLIEAMKLLDHAELLASSQCHGRRERRGRANDNQTAKRRESATKPTDTVRASRNR